MLDKYWGSYFETPSVWKVLGCGRKFKVFVQVVIDAMLRATDVQIERNVG